MERRPSLEGLTLYWNAFADLQTCRPCDFGGPLPIPWTAIDQWARRHGVEGDEFEMLAALIRAMDRTWLEMHANKD